MKGKKKKACKTCRQMRVLMIFVSLAAVLLLLMASNP